MCGAEISADKRLLRAHPESGGLQEAFTARRGPLRLRFMIHFLCIDIPDIILILNTVYDILDGLKRSDHRVVDIVIAVLAVSADAI